MVVFVPRLSLKNNKMSKRERSLSLEVINDVNNNIISYYVVNIHHTSMQKTVSIDENLPKVNVKFFLPDYYASTMTKQVSRQ